MKRFVFEKQNKNLWNVWDYDEKEYVNMFHVQIENINGEYLATNFKSSEIIGRGRVWEAVVNGVIDYLQSIHGEIKYNIVNHQIKQFYTFKE